MSQERRFKRWQRELESKFENWKTEHGLPIWSVDGSNRNFACVRWTGSLDEPHASISHWTKGFSAFIKAHSPCRVITTSDFLRDVPEELNEALALAETLGTEILEIDAQLFAKEKKQMLRDPEMRAKIKAIETSASQEPEYTQSITLWHEGTISKAGILLGERERKPTLVICSDQSNFALTGVETPYEEIAAFINRSLKLWDGGRTQPFRIISREDVLKAQKSVGKIPIFNNHENIPVAVLPLQSSAKDYAAFLSVYFPSREFLAMGSGQPKLIVSRTRESKQRLDEIASEMAT